MYSLLKRSRKSTNPILSFESVEEILLVPSTGYIVDDVLPTFHDKYNDDEDISITVVGVSIDFAKSATAPIFLSRLFSVETGLLIR